MSVDPGNEMDYSVDRIRSISTWRYFHGFTGDICGGCCKRANVLIGPGWLCLCGTYNKLDAVEMRAPYDKPDYGPTLEIINQAGSEK